MTGKKNLLYPAKYAAFLAVILLSIFRLDAEMLYSAEWGYELDLPEGYFLADKSGTDRYRFEHSLFPAQLQIALYPKERFPKAQEALTWVTDQLNSNGPSVSLYWRARDAAIGQVTGDVFGGWACALELTENKGWLVLAATAPKDQALALENLLISTLDSVSTDEGGRVGLGVMTSFAWPPEEPIVAEYRDSQGSLETPFNSIDGEANQAAVDREFALLTAYMGSPFVTEAWKRYYRMIYRDAWPRLAKATFAVSTVLSGNPALDAQRLLSWTQEFTYERNREGSDFVNLPEAFLTKRGDCDSRALLMILMLKQLGIDAILLVSPSLSHAVAAVDCEGEGARFEHRGKKYLIADTTSREKMGRIAANMADSSLWFAVDFTPWQ